MTVFLLRSSAASLFVLSLATPALGQSEPPAGFAREGAYIGLAGSFDFTFDGETFDGMSGYEAIDQPEFVILPHLDKQDLRRFVVGFRATQFALEFSYDRSEHTGTFLDEPGTADFNSINVDIRLFALPHSRIQPHALVGLAFPWLTITDGSFFEGDIGDATFRGQGLNTEIGVTGFVHPRIGASLGYTYRVMWFDRVRGVSDTPYDLMPNFRETSQGLLAMAFFTF